MLQFLSPAARRLKKTEEKLQWAMQGLRIADALFDTMDASVVTDSKHVILRVNDAFARMSGYEPSEVVGKTPRALQSGHHDKSFYRSMLDSIGRTGRWQGEILDRHKDGGIFPRWLSISAIKDEQGTITNFVATYTDLAERKMAQQEIDRLKFNDVLTGLANRTLLMERLSQARIATGERRAWGAIIHVGIDNFRRINDQHGYTIGDLVLRELASRMTQCITDHDTVARVAGDQFAVLLTDAGLSADAAATGAEHVAERLASTINTTGEVEGLSFRCTASMGIALFQGEETSAEDILRYAELATYQQKSAGRSGITFFDKALEKGAHRRAYLERELEQAITDDGLLLHFQPQVSAQLDGFSVFGAEALVRWNHPERGVISPAEFIPLAEESGLIVPLGAKVLESACLELASWQQTQATRSFTLAVNVSARQFLEEGFVDFVSETLKRTGARPERLKLELTESVLVGEVEPVLAKMHQLRSMGVQLSLDDFGTGYSSLSYLRRMPLDQIKIDQSFVRGVTNDAGTAAIVQSFVSLARSMGLSVVAEGVETQEQRNFLVNAGCHLHQGFLYSRPIPIDDFKRHVRELLEAEYSETEIFPLSEAGHPAGIAIGQSAR